MGINSIAELVLSVHSELIMHLHPELQVPLSPELRNAVDQGMPLWLQDPQMPLFRMPDAYMRDLHLILDFIRMRMRWSALALFHWVFQAAVVKISRIRG